MQPRITHDARHCRSSATSVRSFYRLQQKRKYFYFKPGYCKILGLSRTICHIPPTRDVTEGGFLFIRIRPLKQCHSKSKFLQKPPIPQGIAKPSQLNARTFAHGGTLARLTDTHSGVSFYPSVLRYIFRCIGAFSVNRGRVRTMGCLYSVEAL